MAGRTALALPGSEADGPLARALVKLEAVLGADGMVLDLAQPASTADLVAAVDDAAEVRVSYWSASSDEVSERNLVPRAVFSDRGRWYVLADDDRSNEQRTFRIDRILSCERTGRLDEVREVAVPGGDDWFDDLPGSSTVTLRVAPAGRWIVERFPVRSIRDHESGDGSQVVEMVVANESWLRQLLVRLGADATVIAPDEWRELGGRAAAELLAARYAAD
jgi:proteasome accessory factor C